MEERILQFLEENDAPVVGLREGSMLRVRDGSVCLIGHAAPTLRRGKDPAEVTADADLRSVVAHRHAGGALA